MDEELSADERAHLESLARLLGITYDELGELEMEVIEDSDGEGRVFAMTIEFDPGNPPEIMAKIAGVVDGRLEIDAGRSGATGNSGQLL